MREEGDLFGLPAWAFPNARKVLEHPTRFAILEAVDRQPGVTVTQLRKALGLSRRTLDHHLGVLLRGGLVVQRRSLLGRYSTVGIFPPRNEGVLDVALPYFHEGPGGNILRYLWTRGPVATTYVALAAELGLTRKRVVQILSRLQIDGLVFITTQGREKVIHLHPRLPPETYALDAKLRRAGLPPLIVREG